MHFVTAPKRGRIRRRVHQNRRQARLSDGSGLVEYSVITIEKRHDRSAELWNSTRSSVPTLPSACGLIHAVNQHHGGSRRMAGEASSLAGPQHSGPARAPILMFMVSYRYLVARRALPGSTTSTHPRSGNLWPAEPGGSLTRMRRDSLCFVHLKL